MRLFKRFSMLGLMSMAFFSCSSDDDTSEPGGNLSELVGNWELIELNVSPAQDVNEDGTASTNLTEELDCISGTLSFNSDNTWDLDLDGINVVSITGGLFDISCAAFRTSTSGTWQSSGSQVTLFSGGTTILYTLSGERLTNTIGEDLPNIQSEVYQKQ
ncbi:MAG: hypothetical protein AAF361_11665 [Bacteroidota bacterium]